MAEGAKEASGFTRRAFRVRRKEETLRRQEKQTHSEAAEEERSEGRNEPLSDWNAIVAGDVSVFPRPGRACARVLSQVLRYTSGDNPLSEEESLTDGEVLPQAFAQGLFQPSSNYKLTYEKPMVQCYIYFLGNSCIPSDYIHAQN